MVVLFEYLINWFILVLSKFFNKPPQRNIVTQQRR